MDPAASRTAELLTGFPSELEPELDYEDPEELEEAGLEEELGLDEEEEELGLAGLDELELDLSFSFSLSLELLLLFSFSLSFMARSFACFSCSSLLGLDDELELDLLSLPELLVETAVEADGDPDDPDAEWTVCELSSCETSWIEKNSNKRKARFLLTALSSARSTRQWKRTKTNPNDHRQTFRPPQLLLLPASSAQPSQPNLTCPPQPSSWPTERQPTSPSPSQPSSAPLPPASSYSPSPLSPPQVSLSPSPWPSPSPSPSLPSLSSSFSQLLRQL